MGLNPTGPTNNTGDIQHTYAVNKALTEDVVEKMREAYGRDVDTHLVTRKREDTSRDTMIAIFNRQFPSIAADEDRRLRR